MNDAALRHFILSQPIPERLIRDLRLVRDDLTPAERRVLVMLADGYSKPEISARTHWSYESLKDRTASIRLKLRARNTTHAVAIAIRNGLIA